MKQAITFTQWNETPQSYRDFIAHWKLRKSYSTELPTIGECIELLIATSYNFHYDDSTGKFFNRILANEESVIGWDGEELIDILWYEVIVQLKSRFAKGKF